MSDEHQSKPGQIEVVAWSALLAKWTEFARAAVALPRDEQGERWRRSVPAIIGLQAVAMALKEIGRVSAAERAVALDRAEVIIDRHERDLLGLWDETPPKEVERLISDARTELATASNAVRGAEAP